MKKINSQILILVILMNLTGCASSYNRTSMEPLLKTEVYSSVKLDAEAGASCFREETDPEAQALKPLICFMSIIAVADIPLAVAVDTVFLPFDLWMMIHKDEVL